MTRKPSTLVVSGVLFLLLAVGFGLPELSVADVPTYEAGNLGVYYRDWLLCGPFPNSLTKSVIDYRHGERCVGFARDYLAPLGGEQAADPQPGQLVEVPDLEMQRQWFLFESDSDLIPLNDIFDPNDLVVGYAFCAIESPKRQRVMMSIGSNDGVKVWLNGVLTHQVHLPDGRWLQKDDDYVPIMLEKGRNRLLIKVDEGSGDFGFVFRLLDYQKTVEQLRANMEKIKRLAVVTHGDRISVFFGSLYRIEALAPGNKVRIDLLDKAGKVVDSVKGQPGAEIPIPIESIPDGPFTVRASFQLADGETVVSEKRHYKGRLPRHGLPTMLGADLAMRDENGRPYFPIGTYGAPVDQYPKIRKAGYTFVMGSPDSLDAAQAAGLKVGISVHGAGDGWLDQIRKTVRADRDHPAVLFWMLFDEPGYNKADLILMHDAYNLIHKEDPLHPVYLVITDPRVYETFGRCCDVLAIDTYPISRGDLSQVGECIDKAYRISDGDQPVWHCGQLFNWPADRYPTPKEHRLMTYAAIQSGVKAMLWFTYSWQGHALPETEPALWKEQVALIREIKELEPVLVYPGLGERLGTGNHAIRATAKRGPDGELTVFAVNVSQTESLVSRIQLPTRMTREILVLHENRRVPVKEGLLQDRFEPLDAHVYRVRP